MLSIFRGLVLASLATSAVHAQSPATTTSSAAASAVTGCHSHGDDVFCIDGDGSEVQVSMTSTPTGEMPAQFTGCHSHGEERFCKDDGGNEVQIMGEGAAAEDSHEHGSESSGESSGHGEKNCHFHAGVEHCVGPGESENEGESGGSSESSCGIQGRDYDVPLRIGTLFVVLVTSSIGVSLPMLLALLPFHSLNTWVSTVVKQFGTGVIISTAFIHLYTHANLMFTNDCLGELDFEATTSAVVMAGLFIAFLTEYIGHRVIIARASRLPACDSTPESGAHSPKECPTHQQSQAMTLASLGHNHGAPMDPTRPSSKLSVLVMEAGVIFHSVLIGVTLVVAGDSFYKTLLVVIIFHQFFEGMALGARIALLPGKVFPHKALMAAAFALITPIGMAIGLGVLNSFNGNERSTLVALGTLDALSAGILVWVGVVDMWARDWVIDGGELLNAPLGRVATGGISLVAGMALMGLLGKWA
ncbi:putative ZIP Zinc transporter [Aspergillus candidus]|uniref:Putative ZIP zinc transporter n=1 Tax=Aspergillus candidus TaxID=41067 RepID=A0A2I2F9J8_ASPCN|nr:putative ZIP zinc transporter [Aspergillus candidus]PLB37303.1 putative ZIP zinc transporter [Aspergillus candidus]